MVGESFSYLYMLKWKEGARELIPAYTSFKHQISSGAATDEFMAIDANHLLFWSNRVVDGPATTVGLGKDLSGKLWEVKEDGSASSVNDNVQVDE